MSREIKFRAWNKKDKKYIYSDWKYGVVSFWEELASDFTNEYEPPQQFTGLKDKNNNDIYEGDITKCGKSKDAPLSVICFKRQSFLLKYLPLEKNDKNQIYDHMEDYKYYTIIGNTHETKL